LRLMTDDALYNHDDTGIKVERFVVLASIFSEV
jgi:hypothetical protein